MTNKPMLSVERELLELLMRGLNGAADTLTGTEHMRAYRELRALLDEPAAERKPFAWYRVPKDFPLQGAFFPYIEGQSERDIQTSVEAEFGFNVKRLYDEPAAQHHVEPVTESEVERLERRCKNAELALKVQTENCAALKAAQHQGAPVAWVIDTADGRGADYYPGKGLDTLEVGALLYAEQPAPVAVVMTDDQILDAMREHITSADGGYVFDTAPQDVVAAGRALLEVARLNGVKP